MTLNSRPPHSAERDVNAQHIAKQARPPPKSSSLRRNAYVITGQREDEASPISDATRSEDEAIETDDEAAVSITTGSRSSRRIPQPPKPTQIRYYKQLPSTQACLVLAKHVFKTYISTVEPWPGQKTAESMAAAAYDVAVNELIGKLDPSLFANLLAFYTAHHVRRAYNVVGLINGDFGERD